MFARRMKKDKNRYFGPYTSGGAVKDVIELVRKLYQVRSCNRKPSERLWKGPSMPVLSHETVHGVRVPDMRISVPIKKISRKSFVF